MPIQTPHQVNDDSRQSCLFYFFRNNSFALHFPRFIRDSLTPIAIFFIHEDTDEEDDSDDQSEQASAAQQPTASQLPAPTQSSSAPQYPSFPNNPGQPINCCLYYKFSFNSCFQCYDVMCPANRHRTCLSVGGSSLASAHISNFIEKMLYFRLVLFWKIENRPTYLENCMARLPATPNTVRSRKKIRRQNYISLVPFDSEVRN